MTEQKQPEALRLAQFCRAIARGLRVKPYIEDLNAAAALLERQYAEIESLQDDLAHKDDYAEQLGRELAKADSVIKELRAKLDQAAVALKDISNDNWPDAGINAGEYANLVLHELAAGAQPAPITSLQDAHDVVTIECLQDKVRHLESLSVTNILLEVVPGADGMGQEVYARSVKDVEDALGKMGEELEDWQLGIKRYQPAPAGEYPPLPDTGYVLGREADSHTDPAYLLNDPGYTADEMRAYVDADRAMRAAQPAPGAGDQVQMILKHRLMRKVEGDWLAASEFMTGEPDPSWLAKTEESPEEWRIEQARRVSGEQIQAGLTRAFASWKKPAPAAEPIDEYQRGRRAGITEFYDSLYAVDKDRARAALHKIEPQPAPADGWLHSSGMLYRLTDERRPKNRDEINVTMADGSRSLESRSRRAGELLDCIRAMQAAADKKEPT